MSLRLTQFLTVLFLTTYCALSPHNSFAETLKPEDLKTVEFSPPSPTDSPIMTTRSSFTDAWVTVPKGSIQVESGVTYTQVDSKNTNWGYPETLIKTGILDNTELRLGLPNYFNLSPENTDNINQFGDISLGLSQHFRLPRQYDLLVVPMLNIPTGGDSLSSNGIDPQLRVILAKAYTPKITLATMIDSRWLTSNQSPTDYLINHTLIGYYTFSKKWSGFLEYSGFIPSAGNYTAYLQAGLLYLITPKHQLDIRVASGLNNQSSDFLFGVGYSFRLDTLFKKKKS